MLCLRCSALLRRPTTSSASDESRSGRRAATSRRSSFLLLGLATALGGNLGGVSSALLSLDVETARRLRLDSLWPVDGLLRHQQGAYELLLPASWLADVTLERRRNDRLTSLDPPELRGRASRRVVVEPASAFGPPGTAGEENLSVVASEAASSFTLAQLGSAEECALRFLDALVDKGKAIQLSAALVSAGPAAQQGFVFEYTVESSRFHRHNLSLLVVAGGQLYTVTAQVPADRWAEDGPILRRCLESFRVTTSK